MGKNKQNKKRKVHPVKTTSAVVIMRKLQVEEWLKDGYTRQDLIRNGRKARWNVDDRTIDAYIGFVKETWRMYAKAESKYFFEEAQFVRKKLYIRAIAKGDLATARATLVDLDRIRGVYIERVANFNMEPSEKLSDEEKKRIDEEFKKLCGIGDG